MKFRVFGDLHYSVNYQEVAEFNGIRDRFYDYFMGHLFSQPADYYVSIGDLTNTGHPNEYAGIKSIIRKYDHHDQFQFTVGNHDMYIPTKVWVEDFFATPLNRYFVQDDICVIFIDTTRQQHTFDWSGYMDERQLAWLDQVLMENADKTIIIFAHHPVYNTTMFSTDDKASIVAEVPIREILNKHKRKAFYICGHVHADSIVHENNWTYVQIAAVLDQPVVRNIEITDHALTITSESIGEDFRQLGSWLGCRMNHFRLVERGYQGDSNRHMSIEF